MAKEVFSRNWWEQEFKDIDMGDVRLKKRIMQVADQLSSQPLDPINKACFNWADTKATYRLFANEKTTADEIIATHRRRTWERTREYSHVLALQ